MARQESDREDLLREATALVQRVELTCGASESVVIGFRRDGSGSVYFGQDPVLQFNAAAELRRAYSGGQVIKAEQGRLVALTRERSATAVSLVRHEWEPRDVQSFLDAIRERLARLKSCLHSGAFTVDGKVPSSEPVEIRARAWLEQILARPLQIARQPGLR